MPKPSRKISKVAKFVTRRIHELRLRKSQLDIATEAGFRSPNMLSMIKDGKRHRKPPALPTCTSTT